MFKAQIAIFSGDLEGAKLELNKASIKYPENNKIKKMYAQVLIKKEEYKEAIEVYQKVIAADPKDLESQFAEGLVDLQLEHYQRAEEIFKRLSEDPESRYQAYFYLGKAEEKQGNIKKALGWYDKVLDGPFMFESSISAITLLQKDKQLDEASARLGVLQEKFPKQRIKLLLASVDLYSQQKKYDEAFNLLTKALMDYPDQKELLYARALIAERINKIDIVEIDLKKILAVEPNNVEALNALGYTLLSNPARYVDAEKYLKKALELEPEEAIIIDSYGWLQFKLGNAEQALVYLQKAYKKQQENEIAAHLAEVLWALDRKEDAIKIYNGAIKRAQDDEYLRDFQQRIMSGKQ
jgi:tetratricopeptide (TPR) repeat protein